VPATPNATAEQSYVKDHGKRGPYSSGVPAGGTHFEYRKPPSEIIAKVERIKAIAQR
jgi:hypothetical protein